MRKQRGKDVPLTGGGHSRFGKLVEETLQSLIVPVASDAVGNAGIEPSQTDEIYMGQLNGGMMPLAFPSSLAPKGSEHPANVPSTRMENACASGSAAFQRGTRPLLAAVGLEDLDFAEVHDCFTVAGLLMYEAIGLTEPGRGTRAVKEGSVFRDGRLPINVSGGLKDKGRPVGSTCSSQAQAGRLCTPRAAAASLTMSAYLRPPEGPAASPEPCGRYLLSAGRVTVHKGDGRLVWCEAAHD